MSSWAIPTGSTVLVTGINGFIASHVGDQLLKAGYKVRGTVRDESKAEMIRDVYRKRHGLAAFKAVIVEDISAAGSFDQSVQGCSAIAHVATYNSFSPDPDAVITPTVRSVQNVLAAAQKSASVERVVLCSSSVAAAPVMPGEGFHVDSKSWNTAAVEAAWNGKEEGIGKAIQVYSASKVEGEKAAWDFMEKEKPGFTFNSVLPWSVWGEIFDPRQSASSAGFIRAAWNEEEGAGQRLGFLPARWFVNVVDVALLHLAALTESDVEGERLFAYAEPFNNNDTLRMLRKLGPDKKFPADFEDDSRDLSSVDSERSVELLKRYGRHGFAGMEESIRQNVGLVD